MFRADDIPKINEQLIDEIQATFSKNLTHLLLDKNDITLNNIDFNIKNKTVEIIINILDLSKSKKNKISLTENITISYGNCPLSYQPFLIKLLNIKDAYDQLSKDQIEGLKDSFIGGNYLTKLAIVDLSEKILEMAVFTKTISDVKQFVLEAKGLIGTEFIAVEMHEKEVTAQLIRETFYNEMVNQTLNAVNEKWISLEDLEDQDTSIYFALPALTLLEALHQSQDCKGIKLLNNKILTIENCPTEENFDKLFIPILKNKEDMKKLSEQELKVVKLLCLSNKIEFPKELIPYRTKHAASCGTIINGIATEVSQRGFFKNMIKSVIAMCLESLNQKQSCIRIK